MTAILERDRWRCARCGTHITNIPYSVHHRILGNRADNRPSNRVLLCGSGTTGCHGWAHSHPKAARTELGLIISRHDRRPPSQVPVQYDQPGRRGWFTLGDDHTIHPWPPRENQ